MHRMPLRTCLRVVSVSGRTGRLTLSSWILVYLHYISRVAPRCMLHSCFIYELIQPPCSLFRLSDPSLSIAVRFLVLLAIRCASPLLWLWFLESLLYPHSSESFKRTLTQSTGALFYRYIWSLLRIDDEWPLSCLILTRYDVLQSCKVTFQTPYLQPPSPWPRRHLALSIFQSESYLLLISIHILLLMQPRRFACLHQLALVWEISTSSPINWQSRFRKLPPPP